MKLDLHLARRARRLGLALGLTLAAATAQAQTSPPPSGVSYDPPPAAEEQAAPAQAAAPRSRAARRRSEIRPYLEVSQVVSADFNGGDTLTYTSVAAGVDGRIETRRVRVQASYRYERNIEWEGDLGDQDVHSGLAQLNAEVVPGLLNFDAGALATRTGGEGRALGVSDRDSSVEVYSAYAGPTLSTQVGPVSVNASYRLGYVAVDDDSLTGQSDDYDSSVAHSATASVGMAPGRLPFGWTVGAGYVRSDSSGEFDDEFEGAYVRGDVVVPVSPTLAITAGVGYENIQASQNDIARDAGGLPIIGPDGRPIADPSRPRLLTYDLDGVIYDAGIIWRPSPRTELQARAGHRYGGTTVVGSLSHQFNESYGVSAVVYDSVETFGNLLVNDLRTLPTDFDVNRDPITGDFRCVFGGQGGRGVCLDRSLQSIRGGSFRLRGASLLFSGSRGLWSFGAGAGYAQRRYNRPDGAEFATFAGGEDESLSLYASAGRRLSRTSEINFDAYASWFDSDLVGSNQIFSTGATASYSRRLLLDRLEFLAALGLYHSDDGTLDSTIASGLVGLRYTF